VGTRWALHVVAALTCGDRELARARPRSVKGGRPIGVAIDRAGALLVADDVGNNIWRVTPADAQSASR
jgi:glucose/arabinose dehydrogenase